MKISINTLYWDNTNPEIIDAHKKVMDYFNLKVNYTQANIHHGKWIDSIFENDINSDIFIFIDADCIPLKGEYISEAIKYCANGYMVGNAQVTNCIKAKHDLFCAPSFLVISRPYYERIGKPSAVNNKRSDIAQEFTRAAVDAELRLKMNFPTSFQSTPSGGIWRLTGYGYYGIGTIFDEKMYHLFQTRFQQNIELFKDTVQCVLKNDLSSINRKYNCRDEYMGILPIEDDYGY
jgi:hypothetical protein